MYMNEVLVPEAMKLSEKISQITRYRLKDEKYGSENFQIMNYGIGGRISLHLDSIGGNADGTSGNFTQKKIEKNSIFLFQNLKMLEVTE